MERFAGNTIIAQTDIEKFNDEIHKCIEAAEARGDSWEVQYKPLYCEEYNIVYTALILYKTKGDAE